MRHLCLLLALLLPGVFCRAEPLVFHYPDSGAPPWLYLAPGESRPTGLVADILDAAARRSGRPVRYAFQPRESGNQSLLSGSAGGALFFSVTRPPDASLAVTAPLLQMDAVLVTLSHRVLRYERPLDLRDKRLCTLTDEVYPPLTLLAMNGSLLQRKAKTEQAQLMMLRNEDCLAAVMNGPMYHWLSRKYRWDDLRTEARPLLTDNLVLGFAPAERAFASEVSGLVERWRASGELARALSRHLPDNSLAGVR